jgi:hypothetical protein
VPDALPAAGPRRPYRAPRSSPYEDGDASAEGEAAGVEVGASVGVGETSRLGDSLGIAEAPGVLAGGVGLAPGPQAATTAAPTTMAAARRRFMIHLLGSNGACSVDGFARVAAGR